LLYASIQRRQRERDEKKYLQVYCREYVLGGDVLSLPAECISDAIHKTERRRSKNQRARRERRERRERKRNTH
jgi:hypothetical protein